VSGGSASPVVAWPARRLVPLAVAVGVIAYLSFGLNRWVAARCAYPASRVAHPARPRGCLSRNDHAVGGFKPDPWREPEFELIDSALPSRAALSEPIQHNIRGEEEY
jgi:hypothetical protein